MTRVVRNELLLLGRSKATVPHDQPLVVATHVSAVRSVVEDSLASLTTVLALVHVAVSRRKLVRTGGSVVTFGRASWCVGLPVGAAAAQHPEILIIADPRMSRAVNNPGATYGQQCHCSEDEPLHDSTSVSCLLTHTLASKQDAREASIRYRALRQQPRAAG